MKLLTGWWFELPWKIWKSIGMIIPNLWENKKCSKPPTRLIYGVMKLAGQYPQNTVFFVVQYLYFRMLKLPLKQFVLFGYCKHAQFILLKWLALFLFSAKVECHFLELVGWTRNKKWLGVSYLSMVWQCVLATWRSLAFSISKLCWEF